MQAREAHANTLHGDRHDYHPSAQAGAGVAAPAAPPAPHAVPAARLQDTLRCVTDPHSKTEAPKARPCGVIAPERAQRTPPMQNIQLSWLPTDAGYNVASQHPPDSMYPQRNISPRQTFQENMRRIHVPPRCDFSKGISDSALPAGYPYANKNVKNINDTKYCQVPYLPNQIPKQQRSSVVRTNDVYPTSGGAAGAGRGWPMGPPPAYYPPEYYNQHTYPTPPTRQTKLPFKKPSEEIHIKPLYGQNFYRGGDIRFEPYIAGKDNNVRLRYSEAPYPHAMPPSKCDSTKQVTPQVYVNYTPQKYVDPRIAEPRISEQYIDPYSRSTQYVSPINSNSDYISNKPLQATYPMSNALYGYPENVFRLPNPLIQKSPYDGNKSYYDNDYSLSKQLPHNENSYISDTQTQYAVRRQYSVNNYHYNSTQPLSQSRPMNYVYHYPNDNAVKPYPDANLLQQYKHPDMRPHSHNPLAQIPTQFSPNIISPSESNVTLENVPNLNTPQDDCGYVSQCSTTSNTSFDYQYKIRQQTICSSDNRIQHVKPLNSLQNSVKDNSICKEKKNIDVRQFLQNWDEDDEEEGVKSKDTVTHKVDTVDNSGSVPSAEEPLYVLGYVNIPNEEICKYEHIHTVYKLPENIRGYDSADLLNKFDEAFKPSTTDEKLVKDIETKNSRSPSPFDIESKITQSVIHKEVGCNFEIKPFSPPRQIIDSNTYTNNEKTIEKIINQSFCPVNIVDNKEQIDDPKRTVKRPCVDDIDSSIIENKIMKVSENKCTNDITNVCLSSLPRLDNEMELNFTEINEQYNEIKNHESVIQNISSGPKTNNYENDVNANQLNKIRTHKTLDGRKHDISLMTQEVSSDSLKLAKVRKGTTSSISNNHDDAIDQFYANQVHTEIQRKDSVIIKNPDSTEFSFTENSRLHYSDPAFTMDVKNNQNFHSNWSTITCDQNDNSYDMFNISQSKSPINLIMHSQSDDYINCIRPSLIHSIDSNSHTINDHCKGIAPEMTEMELSKETKSNEAMNLMVHTVENSFNGEVHDNTGFYNEVQNKTELFNEFTLLKNDSTNQTHLKPNTDLVVNLDEKQLSSPNTEISLNSNYNLHSSCDVSQEGLNLTDKNINSCEEFLSEKEIDNNTIDEHESSSSNGIGLNMSTTTEITEQLNGNTSIQNLSPGNKLSSHGKETQFKDLSSQNIINDKCNNGFNIFKGNFGSGNKSRVLSNENTVMIEKEKELNIDFTHQPDLPTEVTLIEQNCFVEKISQSVECTGISYKNDTSGDNTKTGSIEDMAVGDLSPNYNYITDPILKEYANASKKKCKGDDTLHVLNVTNSEESIRETISDGIVTYTNNNLDTSSTAVISKNTRENCYDSCTKLRYECCNELVSDCCSKSESEDKQTNVDKVIIGESAQSVGERNVSQARENAIKDYKTFNKLYRHKKEENNSTNETQESNENSDLNYSVEKSEESRYKFSISNQNLNTNKDVRDDTHSEILSKAHEIDQLSKEIQKNIPYLCINLERKFGAHDTNDILNKKEDEDIMRTYCEHDKDADVSNTTDIEINGDFNSTVGEINKSNVHIILQSNKEAIELTDQNLDNEKLTKSPKEDIIIKKDADDKECYLRDDFNSSVQENKSKVHVDIDSNQETIQHILIDNNVSSKTVEEVNIKNKSEDEKDTELTNDVNFSVQEESVNSTHVEINTNKETTQCTYDTGDNEISNNTSEEYCLNKNTEPMDDFNCNMKEENKAHTYIESHDNPEMTEKPCNNEDVFINYTYSQSHNINSNVEQDILAITQDKQGTVSSNDLELDDGDNFQPKRVIPHEKPLKLKDKIQNEKSTLLCEDLDDIDYSDNSNLDNIDFNSHDDEVKSTDTSNVINNTYKDEDTDDEGVCANRECLNVNLGMDSVENTLENTVNNITVKEIELSDDKCELTHSNTIAIVSANTNSTLISISEEDNVSTHVANEEEHCVYNTNLGSTGNNKIVLGTNSTYKNLNENPENKMESEHRIVEKECTDCEVFQIINSNLSVEGYSSESNTFDEMVSNNERKLELVGSYPNYDEELNKTNTILNSNKKNHTLDVSDNKKTFEKVMDSITITSNMPTIEGVKTKSLDFFKNQEVEKISSQFTQKAHGDEMETISKITNSNACTTSITLQTQDVKIQYCTHNSSLQNTTAQLDQLTSSPSNTFEMSQILESNKNVRLEDKYTISGRISEMSKIKSPNDDYIEEESEIVPQLCLVDFADEKPFASDSIITKKINEEIKKPIMSCYRNVDNLFKNVEVDNTILHPNWIEYNAQSSKKGSDYDSDNSDSSSYSSEYTEDKKESYMDGNTQSDYAKSKYYDTGSFEKSVDAKNIPNEVDYEPNNVTNIKTNIDTLITYDINEMSSEDYSDIAKNLHSDNKSNIVHSNNENEKGVAKINILFKSKLNSDNLDITNISKTSQEEKQNKFIDIPSKELSETISINDNSIETENFIHLQMSLINKKRDTFRDRSNMVLKYHNFDNSTNRTRELDLSSDLSFIFDNLLKNDYRVNKVSKIFNNEFFEKTITDECTSNLKQLKRTSETCPESKSVNKVAKLYLEDKAFEMMRIDTQPNQIHRNINSDKYLSKWSNINWASNPYNQLHEYNSNKNDCKDTTNTEDYTLFDIASCDGKLVTDIFADDKEKSDSVKCDTRHTQKGHRFPFCINNPEKPGLYDDLWTAKEVSIISQECTIDNISDSQKHILKQHSDRDLTEYSKIENKHKLTDDYIKKMNAGPIRNSDIDSIIADDRNYSNRCEDIHISENIKGNEESAMTEKIEDDYIVCMEPDSTQEFHENECTHTDNCTEEDSVSIPNSSIDQPFNETIERSKPDKRSIFDRNTDDDCRTLEECDSSNTSEHSNNSSVISCHPDNLKIAQTPTINDNSVDGSFSNSAFSDNMSPEPVFSDNLSSAQYSVQETKDVKGGPRDVDFDCSEFNNCQHSSVNIEYTQLCSNDTISFETFISKENIENENTGLMTPLPEMWLDDTDCVETVVCEDAIDDANTQEEITLINEESQCSIHIGSPVSPKIIDFSAGIADNNDKNRTVQFCHSPVKNVDNTATNVHKKYDNCNVCDTLDRTNPDERNTVLSHRYLLTLPKSPNPKLDINILCENNSNNIKTNEAYPNDIGVQRKETLITKAAQKYVPPLNISAHDFKVRLVLPEDKLEYLRKKKLYHNKHMSPIPKLKIMTCTSKDLNGSDAKRKTKNKPNFNDILKQLDDTQYHYFKHNTRNKTKCVPKVIIKKNTNGSHYTSKRVKKYSPDLTGSKWQPTVILERLSVIEKMVNSSLTNTHCAPCRTYGQGLTLKRKTKITKNQRKKSISK